MKRWIKCIDLQGTEKKIMLSKIHLSLLGMLGSKLFFFYIYISSYMFLLYASYIGTLREVGWRGLVDINFFTTHLS